MTTVVPGCLAAVLFCLVEYPTAQTYCWPGSRDSSQTVRARIRPPKGYARTEVDKGAFGEWLRNLPLKKGRPPVYLYNGRLKGNQSAHHAVIDIDVGAKDLQQCADAVIRLRAEYLYSKHMYDSIHFNFTSGHTIPFGRWAGGERPTVYDGNKVRWVRSAQPDWSYASFRAYLDVIFMYAGSVSYSRELVAVPDIEEIRAGDVFIEGGFPGHAVIVVDVAVNSKDSSKVFLLAQSYMPAQQIHVLRNPDDPELSPWYGTDFGEELVTPEWVFGAGSLKRIRQ
jgi:hypothetical protein